MLDGMRLALSLVLLAGCLVPPSDPPPPTYDPGDITTPIGDPPGCHQDADCGAAKVCGRDRACYPPENIGTARVTWTLHGSPASVSTCAAMPELLLQFRGPNLLSFGYAPVPCENGSFFVDKFPTQYTSVELGPKDSATYSTAEIDRETGEALVLLP